MNKHWPRWIFASLAKHFDLQRDNLKLFVEGQLRTTAKDEEYLELRIDGPYLIEESRNYWKLLTEVNVLVTTKIGTDDTHRMQKNCGVAAAAFHRNISVFKYGNTSDDDQSLLGCMTLVTGGRNALIISHFGQIDTNLQLMQSTVEGHYRLELEA